LRVEDCFGLPLVRINEHPPTTFLAAEREAGVDCLVFRSIGPPRETISSTPHLPSVGAGIVKHLKNNARHAAIYLGRNSLL
jgi:hypothetical protein